MAAEGFFAALGIVKYNTIENIPLVASQRLAVEKEVLETAEKIVATSPQEKQNGFKKWAVRLLKWN
ncbi:MAG: hypothetical protein ACKO4V_07930, partial [Planctomycetota bacterium]